MGPDGFGGILEGGVVLVHDGLGIVPANHSGLKSPPMV
jgi:hypothetical protein